jgi:class 3 adenylate cyclase/DNA-binding NarL/FixJ family response regulator
MTDLPTGSVTLLFSDIEASTILVRRLGERYADVLEEHRRILREAFGCVSGHEIDCRGDEFFAAFDRPESAVAAAVDAQRALAATPWPEGVALRVRMGIHAGEPILSGDDYWGLDVHRAARICSAAHGGQVLVSERTRDLLPDVELKDLGRHRLKGLPAPERLFQVLAPELPSEFPPPAVPRGYEDGEALRVVLADDSVLFREGLALLLENTGFEVTAQAADGDALLERVRETQPDVAIVDVRMPPTHTVEGLRAAHEIRTRHPKVGVLVLSQYAEPAYALELLGESASGVGYLLKDRVSDVEAFAGAVKRVAEGGSALDPEVVAHLVQRRRREDPLDDLAPLDRDLLGLLAEGLATDEIGSRLGLEEREVEERLGRIFATLQLPASPQDHRGVRAVLTFLRG